MLLDRTHHIKWLWILHLWSQILGEGPPLVCLGVAVKSTQLPVVADCRRIKDVFRISESILPWLNVVGCIMMRSYSRLLIENFSLCQRPLKNPKDLFWIFWADSEQMAEHWLELQKTSPQGYTHSLLFMSESWSSNLIVFFHFKNCKSYCYRILLCITS